MWGEPSAQVVAWLQACEECLAKVLLHDGRVALRSAGDEEFKARAKKARSWFEDV